MSDDSSLAQVFQIYSKFELASGAKINLDKCSGLWLGQWISHVDLRFGIKWSMALCKSLGIYIGNCETDHSYTVYRSTKDVSEMTVKASYHFLLECSFNQPHCVEKWRPVQLQERRTE